MFLVHVWHHHSLEPRANFNFKIEMILLEAQVVCT